MAANQNSRLPSLESLQIFFEHTEDTRLIIDSKGRQLKVSQKLVFSKKKRK